MFEDSAVTTTSTELAQLLEQTEDARTALARLQQDMVEAENHLEEADHLLEANEHLVIATLRAHAATDVANSELEKVSQSFELDAVKRASQSKSEFLSRVSHELRTPLNAILGFGHLMLIDDDECGYLNTEQRERLEAIRLAGQQLLALTDDMLDLARIEHGRVRIDMQAVEIYGLIRSAEILLRPSALERKVDVCNLCRKDEDRVMADERALGQVLLNLISNAIKYNRAGGQVTVSAATQLDEIFIVVEDCGLGMSDVQLRDLFQPFNRLGAEQGPMPGSGLGLVISKALVELMGGKLLVSSVEGVGTTVTICLSNCTEPSLPTTSVAVPLSPPARLVSTKRTVLYVEDNPVNALLMTQLFAAESAWTLVIATTGRVGIELAKSLRPYLIILDMQLPDMTGLDILGALQQQKLIPPMGCIALSADAMPQQIEAALSAGFSRYWTKPIAMRQTMSALRELLSADPINLNRELI